MALFLSDAWLADLEAAARVASPPADLTLVVQEVVLHDRGDETAYAIRIGGGKVEVERGRAADADVTFTQDRATATAIASGELSAQSAFMAGRLRMGGDLRAVLERAQDLTVLDDVFASARATTDW
ncbi:MAG: SCP2 sterol-binding domain-containing protein [Acidimicrobiales bacterium]